VRMPRAWLAAAALLAALATAGVAWAQPPAPDAATPAASQTSLEGVADYIESHPVVKWSGVGVRVLAVAFGLVCLVLLYVRWSRAQAGLAPPLPHTPPRAPFPLLQGLGLILLFYLAGALVVAAMTRFDPATAKSFLFRVGVAAIVGVPLAGVVLLRRLRAAEGAPRPLRQVLFVGLAACCVGSGLAILLAFLGIPILKALGHDLTLYGVVKEALDASQPANLWIVAGFGIVVAPVTEEAVFRGLLYPAIRDTLGPGRRGIALGVVVTAALFAASHQHLPSFLPLFGLASVLALVYEWTGSLRATMTAHALFNASSLLPFMLGRLA
jgi:CAAX protease family protein